MFNFDFLFRWVFYLPFVSEEFSLEDPPLGNYKILGVEFTFSGFRLDLEGLDGRVWNRLYKNDPEIKKGKLFSENIGKNITIYRTDEKQGRGLDVEIFPR